ncbi:hypothetical protein [Sporomusa aerivorans]|uniref:hypothetical protein n=1 Tax=Sporomusa aerivorans TaxID=204936 RepID=UPI00352A9D98
MLLTRKQEISLEIEKLLAEIKMLKAQGLPIDTGISQITKLLREYVDLCRIEKQQNRIIHDIQH